MPASRAGTPLEASRHDRSGRRICTTTLLVMGLAVAGCQSGGEDSAATHTAPVALTFPRLQTIPPRPEPALDAATRQSVVQGLVADRELASYTNDVVRYRSGQSSLPPPREPPRAPGAEVARTIVGPATPSAAADEGEVSSYDGFDDAGASDSNLDDFMNEMIRETEPTTSVGADPGPGAAVEPDAERGAGGIATRFAERKRLPGGARLLAGFGLRPRPEEAPVPLPVKASLQTKAGPPPSPPVSAQGGPLIVSEAVALPAADAPVPARAALRYAKAEAGRTRPAAEPKDPAHGELPVQSVGATSAKGDLALIPFAAGATAVPGYVQPMLIHTAAVARQGGGLVVVARSQDRGVAEKRARGVGDALLALGIEADALRLLADGESGREEIRIDQAPR